MTRENADERARELLMGSERKGRAVDYGVYARMMRRSFERVRELRMEKFKFSDICRAYAQAGVLPADADPSSFRKAFRNEEKRRARNVELEKRVSDARNAPVGHGVEGGDKPAVIREADGQPSEKKAPVFHSPALRTSGITSARRQTTPRSAASLGVRPDNTFDIVPIDPDELP